MGIPLRLLIVEDSENDAQLLVREIRRAGYDVESERVETAAAMQAALARQTWDLILCDYSLPTFDAPVRSRGFESQRAGYSLYYLIWYGR